MDRREKLVSVLEGSSESMLAGFWHHFNKTEKFGKPAILAHKNFFEIINPDMLKVMNEHLFVIKETIKNSDDWAKVTRLNFKDNGYDDYIEEFKAIKSQMPKDLPLFATIHGTLVSAYHATEEMGNFINPNNMVSTHLRENPEAVIKGLEVVSDTLCELVEKLIKAGADGIYYAALGGEEYRFTSELFCKYVKPYDDKVINAIHANSAISILHICKDKIVLPNYVGINADIINWDIHDCKYKLSDGRKLFPKKTLLGGFDDRTGILVEGNKSEIEQEVENIVSQAGRKKFILGADCTLPENIEPWRVQVAINKLHSL